MSLETPIMYGLIASPNRQVIIMLIANANDRFVGCITLIIMFATIVQLKQSDVMAIVVMIQNKMLFKH